MTMEPRKALSSIFDFGFGILDWAESGTGEEPVCPSPQPSPRGRGGVHARASDNWTSRVAESGVVKALEQVVPESQAAFAGDGLGSVEVSGDVGSVALAPFCPSPWPSPPGRGEATTRILVYCASRVADSGVGSGEEAGEKVRKWAGSEGGETAEAVMVAGGWVGSPR